jgi:hypothetical protein
MREGGTSFRPVRPSTWSKGGERFRTIVNFNRPAKTPEALPEIFTLLSHTVRGKAGEKRGLERAIRGRRRRRSARSKAGDCHCAIRSTCGGVFRIETGVR